MRTHLRRLAALGVALVAATAAVLVPASAASAAADGTGWSGSWSYYQPGWIHLQESNGGASYDGYVSDSGGNRLNAVGVITDTKADGKCARIRLLAPGLSYFVDRTVCDGQSAYVPTGQRFQGVLVAMISLEQNGVSSQLFYTAIADSTGDPGFGAVGNGMSWSYYTSTSFQYDVRRAGAHLSGYGAASGTGRTVVGTLQSSAAGPCVTGRVSGNTTASASVCGANAYAYLSGSTNITGWLNAEACQTSSASGCLAGFIPEPTT